MGILHDKSFDFALAIIELTQKVKKSGNRHMYIQLFRSGTAIGAIYREAERAESKNDFIHKLSMAQRECNETIFWLELLGSSGFLSEQEISTLVPQAEEIYKMLTSSILTVKAKTKK